MITKCHPKIPTICGKRVNYAHCMVLLFICIFPLNSYGQDNFIVAAGYGYGGDKLAQHLNLPVTDSLRAGEGHQFKIGYHYDMTNNLGLRFLIGIKSAKFKGVGNGATTNRSIKSYPASVLFLYNIQRVSFGAGLAYHIHPVYKVNGFERAELTSTTKFDDAIGYSFLTSVRLSHNQLISLNFIYTKIKYDGATFPEIIGSPHAELSGRTISSMDASNLTIAIMFRI